MRRALAAAPLWGALALACGPAAEPTPPPAGEGLLEIGTSLEDLTGFVPLTAGQDLTLAPGAQGGFHVYLTLRAPAAVLAGLDVAVVEREAKREDTGELVSRARGNAVFVGAADLRQTERPALMFLCPAPVGIAIADQLLVVDARALDPAGRVLATGTARLRPRCPATQEAFCRRICSG